METASKRAIKIMVTAMATLTLVRAFGVTGNY